MENIYLIEHKTSGLWLTINGELTSDKNRAFSFKKKWWAEKFILSMKREYQYSFNGNYRYCLNEISIFTQYFIDKKLRESGINLFADFIVTEYYLNVV